MRALLATTILSLVLAAPAAAATGFDQDPLLVVRYSTFTIAAVEIETQVVIHAGGATEIVDVAAGGAAMTSRGVASQASFTELQQALSAGRVAVERGGCGQPQPDGPVEYHVTWYGRGGVRFNSFRVGANPEGCPASTARLVRAISDLILDIHTSPDTQVFPSRPGG
jgi:hypothetical protein